VSKKDEIYNRYKELCSQPEYTSVTVYHIAVIIAKELCVTQKYISSVISKCENNKTYIRREPSISEHETFGALCDQPLLYKFKSMGIFDVNSIIIKGLCGLPPKRRFTEEIL